jgi:P-type Mg2+ transporter
VPVQGSRSRPSDLTSTARRLFFRSRPHRFLLGMALGTVATAVVLPFVSIGRWFGFVAPPPLFFVYLIVATAAYLALVEISKVFFYRWAVGS